jgi:FkbM family methyltransferase
MHDMNLPESATEVIFPRINWWKTVGARSAIQWYLIRVLQRLGLRGPDRWRVRPRQVRHALTVRLGGSSDFDVFKQIFIQQEYAGLRDLENVSLVLDLGANVGYSSAWFLNCFPRSRVLALEPDEQNVAVSRINLKPYGERARLLNGAAWSESTSLTVLKGAFGDGREWATQVVQPLFGSAGNVRAWDVGTLIDMAGAAKADLLKIDIERAELEVFGETAQAWLPRVRNICIELHGQDCEEMFFNALAGFDYELEHSGELTICRNIRTETHVC